MSRQNLLELGEFDRTRRQDDVPERDTTDSDRPRPKPKPRPKAKRLASKYGTPSTISSPKPIKHRPERDIDQVLSFSSANNSDTGVEGFGIENKSFALEEENNYKGRTGQNKANTKGNYMSSNSESEEEANFRRKKSRSQIFTADVHHHQPHSSFGDGNVSTTSRDEEEATLKIESELKSKSHPPKPKPRSKATASSHIYNSHSGSASGSATSSNRSNRELRQNQADEKEDKEEYLSITIPPETKEEKEFSEVSKAESETDSRAGKSNFMERWKNTAKSFLKSSSSGSTGASASQSQLSQSQSIEMPEITTAGKIKAKLRGSRGKGKKEEKETRINIEAVESEAETRPEAAESSPRNEIEIDKPNSRVSKDEEIEILEKLVESPKISKIKDDFGTTIKEKRKLKKVRQVIEEKPSRSRSQSPAMTDTTIVTNPKTTPKQRKKKQQNNKFVTEEEQRMLLGITIHGSDLLPMDPNVMHPVVKVTVMHEKGKYLTKSKEVSQFWSKSSSSDKKSRKKRKGKESDDHSEDFDSEDDDEMEGESTTRKEKKRDQGKNVVKLKSDSILPIMTQPCQINHKMPTFAPTWNELLLFEERFQRFISGNSKTIILFEIMDFLPIEGPYKISPFQYHGSEAGWYKIAWAFLKPVGANGVRNTDRKLRLQLYKPAMLGSKEAIHGPEVFCWWKLMKRSKLNATLYVTVRGISPPQATAASLRTLLSMRKEHLTQAIIESQLAATKKSKRKKEIATSTAAITDLTVYPRWTRLEGQSCKVPNKILASLPASQVASLNLTVSGNVHCVRFSPCGLKLAAGLDTEELHVILIFEVPSGNLLRSLRGHHGLLYDLTWKILQVDDESAVHYLASASADSTSIIWQMDSGNENSLKVVKTLLHPSFVYCVRFHPSHPSLVATGCFDYIIRVWDIRSRSESRKNDSPEHDSAPVFLLDRHSSFVNCLMFDHQGHHLFSGDGASCVFKWSLRSPSRRKSWKIDKDIKLSDSGKYPINSLYLHPGGNRLLVHVRDSCLKIIDVDTFIILQSFAGLVNEKMQIRSCFSPCGNLVLSGSEDATLCIWDSDTGAIMQFITPENHSNCIVTSVDYHPYDHFVAIGLSSAISEPNPIIMYTYEPPKLKLTLRGVSKLKSNIRKRRSKSPVRETKKTVSFAAHARALAHRGDSSEKFITIIRKLDSALKETHGGSKALSLARSQSQFPSQLISIPPTESSNNKEIKKTFNETPKEVLTDIHVVHGEFEINEDETNSELSKQESQLGYTMMSPTSNRSPRKLHPKGVLQVNLNTNKHEFAEDETNLKPEKDTGQF